MVEVKHEDVEELRKWGMGLDQLVEKCELCQTPTRYWHDPTNTPCCQECAKNARLKGGKLFSTLPLVGADGGTTQGDTQ